MHHGCVCVLNAQPSDAIRLINSGMDTRELTGATIWRPFFLSHLARAYAAIKKFDDAWRSIHEAITTVERTKEGWCEAEVYRTAGEITLLVPKRDATKAEAYFNRSLTVSHSDVSVLYREFTGSPCRTAGNPARRGRLARARAKASEI